MYVYSFLTCPIVDDDMAFKAICLDFLFFIEPVEDFHFFIFGFANLCYGSRAVELFY